MNENITLSKVLFIIAGFILLGLGVAGIILPIVPATPFLLGASLCFMKSSKRLYDWVMRNRFFGPRIARIKDGAGLTAREKIFIYVLVLVMLMPIIILSNSLHLRIFLIALLVIKGIVFLKIKTAPKISGAQTP